MYIIPSSNLREIDREKVAPFARALREGKSNDPVSCVEIDGYLVLTTGHHRFAAHLLVNADLPIEVKVRPSKKSSSFSFSDTHELPEVNWSHVYDWEEAFNVRFLNGLTDQRRQVTKLIVLSGPSGVGKSWVIDQLRKIGLRIKPMLTTTTRRKRDGEVNMVDYEFASDSHFKNLVHERSFCEWQLIHGNYYGSNWEAMMTPSSDSLRVRDLDVYGALQLKSIYPGAITTLFIEPSSFSELRNRLLNRNTESHASLVKRISRARNEWAFREFFDSRIVNAANSYSPSVVADISSRKYPAKDVVPFYLSSDYTGTYACLKIEVKNGFLAWNNIRHPFLPVLDTNGNQLEQSFRCLEQMLLDQLSIEINDEIDSSDLIKSLVRKFDEAQIEDAVPFGKNGQICVFTKSVNMPEFERFAGKRSRFFTILNEIPIFENNN